MKYVSYLKQRDPMKTLLFETTDTKRFEHITVKLKSHNINYTFKMEDIYAKSPFTAMDRNHIPDFSKQSKIRYRIFVDQKDMDQARFLLHDPIEDEE
ncbi:MAG: hypothetical protein ACI32N_06725 [Bulleidia sp.]